MENTIEIKNVTKKFGDFTAVDGTCRSNTFHSILGLGIGKDIQERLNKKSGK